MECMRLLISRISNTYTRFAIPALRVNNTYTVRTILETSDNI